MAVNVASEWLNACSGCEISILNTGEALLDLLPQLNFVHIPALVDHKYFGQLGDGTALEIPEAVVGIVSGGVRNTEHKHVLDEMRKKVKFLIALGSCAAYGGVPAQANMFKGDEVLDKVFRHCVSTNPSPDPEHPDVPEWTATCQALDEVTKVDVTTPRLPAAPGLDRRRPHGPAGGQDCLEPPGAQRLRHLPRHPGEKIGRRPHQAHAGQRRIQS